MKDCESLMSMRFSLRPIAGERLPLPAPRSVREARSTLQAGGRFRFSIPDRSRVDLGDAGRDGGALVMAAGPVGARALADQLGEPRAERPQRCVADREADLGDAEVATTQQRHRALDAPRHEVAVRRLAVGAPELAAEVPGRHVRAAGERLDVQRLGVLPVDPVADAAQPREVAQVLNYVRQPGGHTQPRGFWVCGPYHKDTHGRRLLYALLRCLAPFLCSRDATDAFLLQGKQQDSTY